MKNMADRQKNYKLSLRIYKLNLSIYILSLSLYILRLSIENFMRWQQKKSSVKHEGTEKVITIQSTLQRH